MSYSIQDVNHPSQSELSICWQHLVFWFWVFPSFFMKNALRFSSKSVSTVPLLSLFQIFINVSRLLLPLLSFILWVLTSIILAGFTGAGLDEYSFNVLPLTIIPTIYLLSRVMEHISKTSDSRSALFSRAEPRVLWLYHSCASDGNLKETGSVKGWGWKISKLWNLRSFWCPG